MSTILCEKTNSTPHIKILGDLIEISGAPFQKEESLRKIIYLIEVKIKTVKIKKAVICFNTSSRLLNSAFILAKLLSDNNVKITFGYFDNPSFLIASRLKKEFGVIIEKIEQNKNY